MTDRWIEETLNPDWRVSMKAGAVLQEAANGGRKLVVFENAALGRVLMLDGACAFATAGAFARHEMLAHVALMAHHEPRRVLIVGGGDGGVLRECLKHPSVERAIVVESDHAVTDAVKAHAPEIPSGAFDDPRAELVIADALNYLAAVDEPFDAIIVDGPGISPPAADLATHEFFAACRKALAKDGVLAVVTGLEAFASDRFKATAGLLMPLFKRMAFAMCAPPSPFGGPLAVTLATDDKALLKLDAGDLAKRQKKRAVDGLKYWTPDVHAAAFVLPAFVEGAVAEAIAEARERDARIEAAEGAARAEAKELAKQEIAAAKLAKKQAQEQAQQQAEQEKAAAKAAKREAKERAGHERAAAKAAGKQAKEQAEQEKAAAKAAKREARERAEHERVAAKAAEKQAKERAEQEKAGAKAAKREAKERAEHEHAAAKAVEKAANERSHEEKAAAKALRKADSEREALERTAAKAARKKEKAEKSGKGVAAAP